MDKSLIEKTVYEIVTQILTKQSLDGIDAAQNSDITKQDISKWDYVNGKNQREFATLRRHTQARLAAGHTGTRYLTHTQLRFLADHAAAKDAVESEIDVSFANKHGLQIFSSLCQNRDEYITRPDLGRMLTDESINGIKALNPDKADICIFIADGLSAKAAMENGMDTLLTAKAALESAGIRVAKPFIIKNGRVGSMDAVSEALGTPVTCVLIGERPGLGVADSLSAYAAYNAAAGMSESRRTVISNIHKKGTPSIEAGAWLSDLLADMLHLKLSGVELREAKNREAKR